MTLDPRTIEACAKVADCVADDAEAQIAANNFYYKRSGGRDTGANDCCRSTKFNAQKIAAAIRALASKRCDGCDGHDCDNGCAYPGALPYPSETQSSDSRDIAETIIRDCIPGGQICDPQEIADNIRTWFKSSDGGVEGRAGPSSGLSSRASHLSQELEEAGVKPGPSETECKICGGRGRIPAIISGETRGYEEDSKRVEWSRNNPQICPVCTGTGVSPPAFDPAVTQDCAPAGTVSDVEMLGEKIWNEAPDHTLTRVDAYAIARALLSQFDMRRR